MAMNETNAAVSEPDQKTLKGGQWLPECAEGWWKCDQKGVSKRKSGGAGRPSRHPR